MVIENIAIHGFGGITDFDTALSPELNIIDVRHTDEVSAAMEILLCSQAHSAVPPDWVQPNTRLTAKVAVDGASYTATAVPRAGQLRLTVTDEKGNDATDGYEYLLAHCPEQDATEHFDGQDKSLPLRLCWYRSWEEAPADLPVRTDCRTNMKTFRTHLLGYIKAFQPEPINSAKNYLTEIDRQGKFSVFYPGVTGDVQLSETEEKLFLYICFLNVAEFWADVEQVRDLHYEKKPLVIRNFLERLDETADVSGLIARTLKLQRQAVILTPPLLPEVKNKWHC